MNNGKIDCPYITVVTVCYNSEATIEATIKSVLSQSYDNYEYLIIDGASTDNTLKIVNSYEDCFDGKLRVISEKDSGIYNAMNKGVINAAGDIIGILNSDDYYSADTLSLVARKYTEENYPLLVINGDMMRVSSTGEEIVRYRFSQKNIDDKMPFGHPAMFAAKAVYDKIGLYDESYRFAADGDWQCRAFCDEEVRYVLCNQILSYMREGGASDDFKYRWKWFEERVRMRRQYSLGSTATIICSELFKVLKCDAKNIFPKKLSDRLYVLKYKN